MSSSELVILVTYLLLGTLRSRRKEETELLLVIFSQGKDRACYSGLVARKR
ncbi:hypothetical protein F2Q69_00046566 [Brassica cretica]|uniref:Uncharacterized protein n=1 Tax=Brassica cretica TaxID=69181 RepID=A0A8S9PI54_BRACR|nr:hypothetical protein F2Q69_00046566 [Brassica cretica]